MIKISEVSKEYILKNGRRKLAVRDVDLSITDCGITTILGKSGSGKTTLLNMIGGMDSITSGDIIVDGVSLKGLSSEELAVYRRDNIGFVFQDYKLLEDMTVEANIALASDFLGEKADVNALLERVQLDEKFNKRIVKTLSGGEKQRVAIARALIKNPKIILADEPTGNLDSENSGNIFNILVEIAQDRQVILITHDEDNAMKYSGRVIEISDGEIVNDTRLREIKPCSVVCEARLNKKKGKLAGKNVLKLGWTFFRSHLARGIMAIFAGALCFAMLLSLLSMAAYDNKAQMLKYAKENTHAAVFMGDLTADEATKYLGSPDRIAELNYGKLPFPLISETITDDDNNVIMYQNAKYYAAATDFDKIGFDFRWGGLPKSTKEMTISMSYAQMFVDFGFINQKKATTGGWGDGFEYSSVKVGNIDELIELFNSGEKFIQEYAIVGIHNDYALELKTLPAYSKTAEMPLALTAFYHDDEVERFKNSYALFKTEKAFKFSSTDGLKDFIYNHSYVGGSQATSAFDNIKSDSDTWAIGCGIVAGVFVLLTAILLPILISNIVSDKKSEIGIMRTLGATRGDIAKIFAVNCGIIALAICLIGALLGGGVLLLYNLTVVATYAGGFIKVPMLFWHMVVVVAGVLLMIAACCIAPIIKIIMKSPVAIIRENK